MIFARLLDMVTKRFFDFALATVGIALLSPILGSVALILLVVQGRPILFTQHRVGRHGRLFKILKFRTMLSAPGPQVTSSGDARITPLGRMLRSTKLDELPQLFNVVVGEMSFVGPRPEVPKYVAFYSAAEREILQVRPGITDIASISYLDEERLLSRASNPEHEYIYHVMPHKLALNLEYLHNRTLFSDLWIILKTIARIALKVSKDRLE